jgi:hypothetical protein
MVLDNKGNSNTQKIYKGMRISKINEIIGQPEANKFFKPKNKDKPSPKSKFLFVPELIEEVTSVSDDEDSVESDAVDLSEDLF